MKKPKKLTADEMNHADFLAQKWDVPHVLTWNTGRSYTAKGQRMAALQIDGGVLFEDIDRGIGAFIPNCAFDRFTIMAAYDHNLTQFNAPSLDSNQPALQGLEREAWRTASDAVHERRHGLKELLHAAALNVAPVRF